MNKILVTGADGQVGRSLVQRLHGRCVLLATCRKDLDVTDRDAVFKIVSGFKPDIIINAAAYTAVDKAEEKKELSEAVNTRAPGYLAESAAAIGSAILHISTDYVFDGELSLYCENDIANPINVYGLTKFNGETAVKEANSRHVILRTSRVFSEYGDNFVKTMLDMGCESKILNVVDGQVSGPTYAGDIAAAMIKIANKIITNGECEYGIYHFSGLPYVSWLGFASVVFEEALAQGVIKKAPHLIAVATENYPTTAKRPTNSKLNVMKIKDSFDIVHSDWIFALKNIKGYSTR